MDLQRSEMSREARALLRKAELDCRAARFEEVVKAETRGSTSGMSDTRWRQVVPRGLIRPITQFDLLRPVSTCRS